MFEAPFRQAIRDYIGREARPVDKFSHQPRLYALCRRIGEGLDYDDDVVFAAAWLHDVGVFIGHRPENVEELKRWDNVAYAVNLAPALLAQMNFPSDKVNAVVEAIRTHQPAAQPIAIEGVILRDADILEQLGAVGILRTVSKVGRDSRFVTHADAVEALRKALMTLPEQIRLERARALVAPRIQALQSFLDSADAELT